jgi:hypothetical protein
MYSCGCMFCEQLLRIEEELGDKAVYAGENWRPKL